MARLIPIEPEHDWLGATPRLAKLLRIMEEETRNFHLRQQLAQVITGTLPQLSFNRVRTAILRAGGLEIGRGSLVMGPLTISGDGDWTLLLSVGVDTFISGPLRINLGGEVRIGDRVNIGHDVCLLTVHHGIGPDSRRAGSSECRPIVVEDGVWIASRATVLPGVRVGAGAVIAAGAVVTCDVPPGVLVAGVPARVVRDLGEPVESPPPTARVVRR